MSTASTNKRSAEGPPRSVPGAASTAQPPVSAVATSGGSMQRYEALRRLAALLRAMAWIALVIGMLLVLALTFQSSDESSFFVQEITPGERVLRFVVGTLSVAYFAIPLMALGYMIPPILDIREELETKLDTHYRYLHGLWAKSQGDVPSG